MDDLGGNAAAAPPPSRRRRSAPRASRVERTARIVRATADVVGEYGITEARVSDIAERAGMSTGHVLYYFPSKDALLLATLEAIEVGLFESVGEPAETTVQELRDLLIRNTATGLGDVRFLLWLSVWERASRDEAVRSVASRVSERWISRIEALLERARDLGEIDCDDVHLEALRLMSLIDGLGLAITAAATFIDRETAIDILDNELSRLAR